MRSVDSATAAESVAQGTFILAQSRISRAGGCSSSRTARISRAGGRSSSRKAHISRAGGAFALAKNESAAAPRHLCSFSLIMPTPCIAQRTRRPITAAAYTMSDTPVHSTSRPNEPRLVAAAGTK